jgi:hypothetical protein
LRPAGARHGRRDGCQPDDGAVLAGPVWAPERARGARCEAERVTAWRQRTKQRLVEEAGGACAICGYDRCLAALQFHHLDPGEKSFALSHRGLARSFERTREEARKCILLCANCHAEVEAGFAELPLAADGAAAGSDLRVAHA